MSSRPLHGILVLRDLSVDTLVLDGVELPDPHRVDDPVHRGSFRGYFDVPAGPHTLVARIQGKEHTVSVVVLPGWATIKRLDSAAGWVDDDVDTALHYRRLAVSGSMAAAGALRPWPLATLCLRGNAADVRLDAQLLPPTMLPVRAVVNIPPGRHAIEVGPAGEAASAKEEVELAPGSVSVVEVGAAASAKVKPLSSDAFARELAVLPFDSLLRFGAYEHVARQFGEGDLAWLVPAFTESAGAAGDSTAVDRYVTALRWHYVIDREMAAQASYFGRLGRTLAAHVTERPSLLGTGAALYLGYFAEDLVDAGDPETIAGGEALAEAIATAEVATPARPSPRPPPPPPPSTGPSKRKNEAQSTLDPRLQLLVMFGAAAIVAVIVFLLRR